MWCGVVSYRLEDKVEALVRVQQTLLHKDKNNNTDTDTDTEGLLARRIAQLEASLVGVLCLVQCMYAQAHIIASAWMYQYYMKWTL